MFGVLSWSFIFVVCDAAFHKRLPVGKIVPRPNYCAIKNHYDLHLLPSGMIRVKPVFALIYYGVKNQRYEASENKLEIVSSGKRHCEILIRSNYADKISIVAPINTENFVSGITSLSRLPN